MNNNNIDFTIVLEGTQKNSTLAKLGTLLKHLWIFNKSKMYSYDKMEMFFSFAVGLLSANVMILIDNYLTRSPLAITHPKLAKYLMPATFGSLYVTALFKVMN